MTLAVLTTALVLFFCQGSASKPKPQDCPMHDAHAQMNERGEHAMGFSQTAATHHFFLKPDGGVIQVEVLRFRLAGRALTEEQNKRGR